MEIINQQLFMLLNASNIPSGLFATLLPMVTELPLYLVPAGLVIMWFGKAKSKETAFHIACATSLCLTINVLIGLVWFHNRPFMDHLGLQLIPHAADSSFPSDHVTLIATASFILFLLKQFMPVARMLFIGAIITGWTRVYSGVHYPLDILGALIISYLVAAFYIRFIRVHARRLFLITLHVERYVLSFLVKRPATKKAK